MPLVLEVTLTAMPEREGRNALVLALARSPELATAVLPLARAYTGVAVGGHSCFLFVRAEGDGIFIAIWPDQDVLVGGPARKRYSPDLHEHTDAFFVADPPVRSDRRG